MKRITIKDVAREAGVSYSAVSRAFQDGGSIAGHTRDKVMEAAGKLGYRPSPIARGLVQGRSGLVTLVTGPRQSWFDTLFFDVLSSELARSGRHLLVATVHSRDEMEAGLMQAVDYRSEAVIVSAGTMSLELSSECVDAGVPVILSGRILEARGVQCILADNESGARQAGALLAHSGMTPIAFFGQGGRTFADRERCVGFNAALTEAGIAKTNLMVVDAGPEENTPQAALALLSRHGRPQAVFCSNDGLALTLIQAALQLGLSVPQELAVIGFDNIPMAAWPSFSLTTVDYPVHTLVRTIMDCLRAEAITESLDRIGTLHRLNTRLVVRHSTPAFNRFQVGAHSPPVARQ